MVLWRSPYWVDTFQIYPPLSAAFRTSSKDESEYDGNKLDIFKEGSLTQCTRTAFKKGPLDVQKQIKEFHVLRCRRKTSKETRKYLKGRYTMQCNISTTYLYIYFYHRSIIVSSRWKIPFHLDGLIPSVQSSFHIAGAL